MSVDMECYIAYQQGYEAGKRDAASPWHRVEDELPKDGLIGKLVIDTEGQINICRGYATITLTNGSVVLMDDRILDVFKEETDNWNWDDVTHFTHWMPIEPPKEDGERREEDAQH